MLEEELRKRPLFRRLGGIGIDPRAPATVASALRAVRGLRQAGDAFFLSYFPQGRILPSAARPLGFQGGVDLFLRAMAPATVIPAGIHMEPMRKLRPAMFVSLGRPFKIDKASSVAAILESLVAAELDRIQARLRTWDEDRMGLTPGSAPVSPAVHPTAGLAKAAPASAASAAGSLAAPAGVPRVPEARSA
jgi:hypothetical protein